MKRCLSGRRIRVEHTPQRTCRSSTHARQVPRIADQGRKVLPALSVALVRSRIAEHEQETNNDREEGHCMSATSKPRRYSPTLLVNATCFPNTILAAATAAAKSASMITGPATMGIMLLWYTSTSASHEILESYDSEKYSAGGGAPLASSPRHSGDAGGTRGSSSAA